jgi:high-affinity nickel permease
MASAHRRLFATALSVAVALVIGFVELLQVLVVMRCFKGLFSNGGGGA